MADSDPPTDGDGGVSDPATTDESGDADPANSTTRPRDGGADEAMGASAARADRADPSPPAELVTERRTLDPRVRWKWLARAGVVAVLAGVVVGAISVIGLEWGPLPGVGAFLVVCVGGVAHALLLFGSWEYEVRTDALYLQRGVITHVSTVVPFVRVQHIDTSRGPIERVLGLSSLVVYTAGSRGADVTVPGLTPAAADDLQDRLKVLAKDAAGEDAV